MRKLEDFKDDVQSASVQRDAASLRTLADTLTAMASREADAVAAEALAVVHSITGDTVQALEYYQRAVDIFSEFGDLMAVARLVASIGIVYISTGEYALAMEYYQRALDTYVSENDRVRAAGMTGNIGNLYYVTGDYARAIEHYERALATQEELGNRKGAATFILNLGNVYHRIGNYPLALEQYHRAWAAFKETGNRSEMAVAMMNVGNVYAEIGDYPQALHHLRKALTVHEALGDRPNTALVAGNIGHMFAVIGNYDQALEYLRSALAAQLELKNPRLVAQVTGAIGVVYGKNGDYVKALDQFRSALTINEELNNRTGVSSMIASIIGCLIGLEKFTEASAYLEQQSVMLLEDQSILGRFAIHRAALAEYENNLDLAHQYLTDSLTSSIQGGRPEDEAECHLLLRELAQKRNDFAGYVTHNNEYTRITEEIRGKDVTQKLTMMEAEHRIEAEMRERDKERAILYSTLPKHVADRIVRGEKVSGDHFDNAAVLFTDVVGFTSHTSTMHATEVVELLEQLFASFEAICEQHQVIKVKTIGDAFMCFKGDATAEDNAVAVARAALAMSKPTLTWPNGDVLSIRVGIHSGSATAGVIGTQRLQYDVWGDTVNVASRLESTSEPGRIHVSDAFARVIPIEVKDLILTLRGETDLKGKGRLTTYWLEDI